MCPSPTNFALCEVTSKIGDYYGTRESQKNRKLKIRKIDTRWGFNPHLLISVIVYPITIARKRKRIYTYAVIPPSPAGVCVCVCVSGYTFHLPLFVGFRKPASYFCTAQSLVVRSLKASLQEGQLEGPCTTQPGAAGGRAQASALLCERTIHQISIQPPIFRRFDTKERERGK